MSSGKIITLPKEFSCPVLLGRGSYSSVYRVYQQRLDRIIAVKVFNRKNEKQLIHLRNETRTLTNASLSCAPKIHDVYSHKSGILLLMEWIRGIPLNVLCKELSTDIDYIRIASSLLHALTDIHKCNIVHRDLKPENVIITSDYKAVFVDFGFSSDDHRPAFSDKPVAGTIDFMAPELWNNSVTIEYRKCDYFAIGRIIEKTLGIELPPTLKAIVHPDPLIRLTDADTVLAECNSSFKVNTQAQTHNSSLEERISHYLVSLYTDAAKQLYENRHIREAYQILAEILEESPDNAEAFLMLQNMKHPRKIKSVPGLIILISIIISTILIPIGYFFGQNTTANFNLLTFQSKASGNSTLLQPISVNSEFYNKSSPVQLKNDIGMSTVSGELNCLVPSQPGALLIDKKNYSDRVTTKRECSVTLSQGEHVIQWNDSATNQYITETVRLKPFEKKWIKLSISPPEIQTKRGNK